jgi:hypothetical protein
MSSLKFKFALSRSIDRSSVEEELRLEWKTGILPVMAGGPLARPGAWLGHLQIFTGREARLP